MAAVDGKCHTILKRARNITNPPTIRSKGRRRGKWISDQHCTQLINDPKERIFHFVLSPKQRNRRTTHTVRNRNIFESFDIFMYSDPHKYWVKVEKICFARVGRIRFDSRWDFCWRLLAFTLSMLVLNQVHRNESFLWKPKILILGFLLFIVI